MTTTPHSETARGAASQRHSSIVENMAALIYQRLVFPPAVTNGHTPYYAWQNLSEEAAAPYRAAAAACITFLQDKASEDLGLSEMAVVATTIFGNSQMGQVSRLIASHLTTICTALAMQSYLAVQHETPSMNERGRIDVKKGVTALRGLGRAIETAALQGNLDTLLETLRTWEAPL